jgi:cell division transport system permease protein
MMKHNFGFFIREGISNMFSHGFMSFAAVGITVACLVIMGTFSLVAFNANENLKNLQRENAVLAFVDETLSDEDAMALEEELEKLPNVADCTFVSREEARDRYVEQYDEDDLYSNLDPEIFRHRYVLHLNDLDQMRETAEAISNVEGVVKIRADEDISNGFLTVRNIAGVISIALIAVLLIVSIFIISNTIKLTTFDRKEEIAIMKMVGATDGFVRWPFVYEGLLLGLVSALVAFGFQWVLYRAIMQGVENSDTLQLLRITPFEQIWLPVAVAFGVVGIFVGIGGSLTAIRKFLRV